jgi:MtrB/PioB family decaheme-associated outer membrane protein
MKRAHLPFPPRPTLLALALCSALAPAAAQTLDAGVSFGLVGVSGDSASRALFGQYNGLRTGADVFGVLGVDLYRRDADSGIVTSVLGTNLLGDTRELGLHWKQQGLWKLAIEFQQGVRSDPNTIRSALAGAGTTTPQVNVVAPGLGNELELKVKRTGLGVSLWRSITPTVLLEMSLKSEDKEGARLFGIGMNCPSPIAPGCRGTTGANVGWALLMLPEPIDANHTQFEARISHAGEQLRLSAGYYGSFYANRNSRLTAGVPGSLNNAVGELLPLNTGLQGILGLPLALAPDNQAHHFDLTASYALTPTTQARLKLSYAKALQNQDFAAAGFSDAPAGVANLGGRVDTTLVIAGITARPLPRLALHADVRLENRDDRTPIALYNVEDTDTYTNRQLPSHRKKAKLQANYQFANGVRGTLAADFEAIDRGVFTATSAVAGISALRQKTDETGLRADLRRTVSEDLSLSAGIEHQRRGGSNWLRDNSGLGVTEVSDPNDPASGLGPNAIYMPTLADRTRDKLRLRADWQPMEDLSLQFSTSGGRDRYDTPGTQGLQSSAMGQFSVDGSYALSDRWNFNGWLTHGRQQLHQSRPAGYILSFANTSDSLGLGFSGKPAGRFEFGGSLSATVDRNAYEQGLDASAPPESVALLAATGGLPDVVFRQATLRLFSKFAIDKQSAARLEFLHQRSFQNDWTWGAAGVPFAYSDGSTVWQQANQRVTMIGLSYTYRWH